MVKSTYHTKNNQILLKNLVQHKEVGMAEKVDLASAYRRLKSPNIKTRKRALKIIHDYKRFKKVN